MGLFASLLIGTILSTLADKLSLDWLKEIASFASAATGSAMAVAIGLALQAPPLVLFSLCAALVGLIVLLVVYVSGRYFVKSILVPVQELTESTARIPSQKGDYFVVWAMFPRADGYIQTGGAQG